MHIKENTTDLFLYLLFYILILTEGLHFVKYASSSRKEK